jgi:hypothetical protein
MKIKTECENERFHNTAIKEIEMFKKIILTLALTTLSLFATNNLELYYDTEYNTIGVVPIDTETIDENSDDWVGIYQKGASNDWDNVIKWSWAKDLNVWHDQQNARYIKVYNFNGLDEGSYDVRYFKNNSFTTYRSHSFNIGEDGGEATLSINNQTDTILTIDSTYQGDQSWVGIYKKGASNDWNNVKVWSWIRESKNSFNIANLDGGTYEARLFYNNSYDLETKVEFIVDGGGEEANIEITNLSTTTVTVNTTFQGNQSWIGIYEKGASNDWANVKAWSWVNQNKTNLDINNLSEGTYEARLFYNNSYAVEDKVEFEYISESIYNKILADILNRHNFPSHPNPDIKPHLTMQKYDNYVFSKLSNNAMSSGQILWSIYKVENGNVNLIDDLESFSRSYGGPSNSSSLTIENTQRNGNIFSYTKISTNKPGWESHYECEFNLNTKVKNCNQI